MKKEKMMIIAMAILSAITAAVMMISKKWYAAVGSITFTIVWIMEYHSILLTEKQLKVRRCEVCGKPLVLNKTMIYTIYIKNNFLTPPERYDAVNCIHCGCQNQLHKHYTEEREESNEYDSSSNNSNHMFNNSISEQEQ